MAARVLNFPLQTNGFGVHKLPLKPGTPRKQRLERSQQMLARVLNLRTAIAFVGSGCSVPLGYPTWQDFTLTVVRHTLNNVASQPFASKELRDQLTRFTKQLRNKERIGTDQMLFMLGVCQQAFEEKDGKKGKAEFRQFVAAQFGPRKKRPPVFNPYHALMDLPISRFITSNYDFELEEALAEKRQVKRTHLQLDASEPVCPPQSLRTFTQQPEHFDQLALFVLSRVEAADNMVFHCHGSYRDPASMVITESDYQAWYFGEQDEAGVGFRQNLHLLFGSNPILFVGFGLADDDLLRPLRMFAAEDLKGKGKSSRPLFALMPQKETASDEERKLNEDYFDQLYDRYGVHVIPYSLSEAKDANAKKLTLYHELERWRDYRLDARNSWLQKPAVRQVDVNDHPPEPYHHYPFQRHATDFTGGRVSDLLEKLYGEARDGTRVIGLIGQGGTGKSWFAQELLESMRKTPYDFRGSFFWSSYYSNDSLTGLDRALAYLDPNRSHKGDRIERFIECLHDARHLLVFDGIERFLHPTNDPLEGKALTPLAEKLLEAMCSERSRSTIVITSRVWPKVFGPMHEESGPIIFHRMQRFSSEDISDFEPFKWLGPKDVSALVSLLDGHIHALVLAAEMLRKAGIKGAADKLKEITQTLSGTPPEHRGDRMIRKAIESLNEQSNDLALKLLERMSVFMAPVSDNTVAICFTEACRGMTKVPIDPTRLVEMLADSRLLHRTKPKPGVSGHSYTVHPIVREYIFQQIHHAPVGALPNFTLPGFTAVTSAFHPGSKESVILMKDLFATLCEKAEEKLTAKDLPSARALCRSAFSVIRSRMEALTTPRWCSYDEYLQVLIVVSHLARKVSDPKDLWSYAERQSIANVENKNGSLYADELAWLYNELGLACYGEGAMPDTLAIWEQGLEINRAIDSHQEGGSYLFQSLCNLGAAHIHYGRLDDAEKYLHHAEEINFRLNDEDHAGRIKGYLALCKHLRGNLPEADRMYDEALQKLHPDQNWNPRARSIFLRHRADLKIKLREYNEARSFIDISRGLAEEQSFPELAAAARLSLGHWFRSQERYSEALREYNVALREAKRIGMRRLECEVISEFARLALDLGDSHTARQRAVESLLIANELVMGLKQTHDLVVLGRATIEARQHKLGVAYLKHAKRLADRQGYWLRSHEAEEELHRFGESASESEE